MGFSHTDRLFLDLIVSNFALPISMLAISANERIEISAAVITNAKRKGRKEVTSSHAILSVLYEFKKD